MSEQEYNRRRDALPPSIAARIRDCPILHRAVHFYLLGMVSWADAMQEAAIHLSLRVEQQNQQIRSLYENGLPTIIIKSHTAPDVKLTPKDKP